MGSCGFEVVRGGCNWTWHEVCVVLGLRQVSRNVQCDVAMQSHLSELEILLNLDCDFEFIPVVLPRLGFPVASAWHTACNAIA